MAAARILGQPEKRAARRASWATRLSERMGEWIHRLETGYRDLLQQALRHRVATVLGASALFAGSLLLLPLIGTEFLPPSDEGEVRVIGEMEPGTRLELVDEQTRKMERIVYAAVPEAVSSVVTVVTSSRRAGGASQGEIRMSLVPAAERTRSNSSIASDLRRLLDGKIAGMTIRTRAPQGQFLLERLLASEEGVVVEVRGFDLPTLGALSRQVEQAAADVPGVTDVDVSRKAGIPEFDIRVDRQKVANLGLSVRDVTAVIETAMAGSQAGDYRVHGNSYRILVQLEDAERRSLDEVLDLTLNTPSGEQVSLRNLVQASYTRGPILIDRKDQQRLVTVRANVAGRDLGSVARDVQAHLDQIARPTGYDLRVAGNFEEQQKAFRELLIALGLALILVYMVLASQYESLRDPIVVMGSVPLAAVGVLLILFLTHTTLNLQSFIGCIMLGGIVVNNAILLVDQAGQLRRAGMNVIESAAEAGRRRLRPILMTTLTTILALMPLALGIGEGADAQAPLARAVIGGLTASTLVTLVLIPVVYTLFYGTREAGRIGPPVEA
jgi:HAE1 family hydrophobic/amphiphilic exporter-1